MYFYIILPLFQKVNPVVDFGITLCAGGFVTMPKFTTGSTPYPKNKKPTMKVGFDFFLLCSIVEATVE